MAVSKSFSFVPANKPEDEQRERRKMWRALGVLLLFAAILGVVVVLLFCVRRALFDHNPHFTLKTLEIRGGTFWQDRSDLLAQRIGLHKGVNLFQLDYYELRKKIEDIPGIEKAGIVRILPDKLQITLLERIPRAVLSSTAGKFVVDEHGVVILRDESSARGKMIKLPVITSVPGRDAVLPGDVLSTLKPSLDLIMMTLQNFSDIEIICIMPGHEEKLDFVMRYRGGKYYRVAIPLQNRGLPYLLSALQTAIINAHWKRIKVSEINLLFDGRVVLK